MGVCHIYQNVLGIRVLPKGKCFDLLLTFNQYHVAQGGSQICKDQVLNELYNEAFTDFYLVT